MEWAETLHVLLVSPWATYQMSYICSNQKVCCNFLKDWAIYKIGKVFGWNFIFCIFGARAYSISNFLFYNNLQQILIQILEIAANTLSL